MKFVIGYTSAELSWKSSGVEGDPRELVSRVCQAKAERLPPPPGAIAENTVEITATAALAPRQYELFADESEAASVITIVSRPSPATTTGTSAASPTGDGFCTESLRIEDESYGTRRTAPRTKPG